MKKLFALALILCACVAAAAVAQVPYLPTYWVIGEVRDSADGAAQAEGVTVFFYDEKNTNLGSATAIIEGGKFMINAFEAYELGLTVGETYNVATQQTASGYGANGKITISGAGWDQVSAMTLVKGGGIIDPTKTVVETAPVIEQIRIGNRVYFKHLVEPTDPNKEPTKFVTGPNPEITVKIAGRDDFGVDASTFSIIRDEGNATNVFTYDVTSASKAESKSADDTVNALTVRFQIPDTQPLATPDDTEEEHTLTFSISSAGNKGTASATEETARVSVLAGPLRLVGKILVFPVPFSRVRDGNMEIQYTLSEDADLEIYVTSAGGEIIKRWTIFAGTEFGKAGTNKLLWDSRGDSGVYAGNGIYVGTIVGKEENKLLGKFKLTVLN